MLTIFRHTSRISLHALLAASLTLPLAAISSQSAFAAAPATTAWKDGRFNIDISNVVGRSDIILQRANVSRDDAMPLGNGRLGLGVWSEDGYTAQLNREDTWPKRLSPGQVVIPSLGKLTGASDFKARLDLYNGEFIEQGGGMTAITYVEPDLDVMVVEVKGATPGALQTAELKLWAPRSPEVSTEKNIALLTESWRDTNELGATGLTFGSIAGLTADGRDLHVEATGPRSVKITFRPNADGTFKILVASPTWEGQDALQTSADLLNAAKQLDAQNHRTWWNELWQNVDLIKLSSADHKAEYFENLRMIDLFTAVAESRDRFPGGQAGIGDLFSSYKDDHYWSPSGWWHWNLRMQVSANDGAGLAQYNIPYFNLYNDNLDNIAHWTREHMPGYQGVCVPETLRFNGQGYENEYWLKSQGISCSADSRPYFNARTLSTGAEISLWIWQHYLYTDDKEFLEANYKLMKDSVLFLLSYAKRGPDGKLYTYPSNAHESNWDAVNPTTDVSAMRALFPAFIQAANTMNMDADLVKRVQDAIPLLPELPERNPDQNVPLKPGEPRDHSVIANSYSLNPIKHNNENIGLEPIWPYGLIGDDGPLHDLGVRTYNDRPNKFRADWSADPVQAARLGLASEVEKSLVALTEEYQLTPAGFAQMKQRSEFYVEQIGVVADAVQHALVQDYDGLLRIAPALPEGWNADGSVSIPHKGRVYVQAHDGQVVTVGIQAGDAQELKMRNPWKGKSIKVIDASTNAVVQQSSQPIFTVALEAGKSYLVQPADGTNLPFAPVTGTPATAPKRLITRTIGIEAAQK